MRVSGDTLSHLIVKVMRVSGDTLSHLFQWKYWDSDSGSIVTPVVVVVL